MDTIRRKRQAIIILSENTLLSQRDIAQKVNVSRSTVSRILKLKHTKCSFSPKKKGKCGRKRSTTVRDDAYLLRMSKIDRQIDLANAGTNVHSSIVRHRLLDVGRKA